MDTANISFTQAVDGYFLAAQARHLSSHTLDDYANTYRKFFKFMQIDLPFRSISAQKVESFMRVQEVSKKTILNYAIGLSALWTWAVKEDLVKANIMSKVDKPKPEKMAIVPFTRDELKALLNGLTSCKQYSAFGRKDLSRSLPGSLRNRAIILVLLDTGIRASELTDAVIRDLDLKNSRLRVMGKGDKERVVPFSARTGQALWKYLATRPDDGPADYLFSTKTATGLDRRNLLRMLGRLGDRAGVPDVHPHRFRHTFAINYLRNGGDAFTLQAILGHSTMKMVRVYLRLAQADLDEAHHRASPVDRWGL